MPKHKKTMKINTVPFPFPPRNEHTITRNLENRETKIQSCLWRKMLAFIQKNHSLMDALHHVFFFSVRLPVQFPCKAMA